MKTLSYENQIDELELAIKTLPKKKIEQAIIKICKTLKKNKKIFICGNGGSMAHAHHLSAELLIRFNPLIKRKGYKIINLDMNLATITACSNDLSYEKVFSRNLDTLCENNDLLLVLSTSGNSKNILETLKIAKKRKIYSIGFYGRKKGTCEKFTNLCIKVNSNDTARIQEAHLFIGHYIFGQVEKILN